MNTGHLTAHAEATRAGCQPSGEVWARWFFTPSADQAGKVKVRLTQYTFSVPTLDASGSGIYGGGTGEAYIFLSVKDQNTGKSVRRVVRRTVAAAVDGGLPGYISDNYDSEPFVLQIQAGHTYEIEASLLAAATHYAECSYYGTGCQWGRGEVEAEAWIQEIMMVPDGQPWISVNFGDRQNINEPNFDTWNAYEAAEWYAAGEQYYPDQISVTIHAGGEYDHSLSYVDLTFPGDSITSWSSTPALTGTQSVDSLRVYLPDPATLGWWGGKWVVNVGINPEADELSVIRCGIPFPLAALFEDSEAVAVGASMAGVDPSVLFEPEYWQVNYGLGWVSLNFALEEGWAWSVTNPANVRFPPTAPILLSDIFAASGLNYTEPTLQEVFDEIRVSCRGVSFTTPDEPVTYPWFPHGENSYGEERTWEVLGYVEGTGTYQSDADTDRVHLQLTFDDYPRRWSLGTVVIPTVTRKGLVVLLLLMVVAAAIVVRRRRRAAV